LVNETSELIDRALSLTNDRCTIMSHSVTSTPNKVLGSWIYQLYTCLGQNCFNNTQTLQLIAGLRFNPWK